MPRIPPWLFRQANQLSPDLATLIPACRDLQSARNELRWIQDHVRETAHDGRSILVSDLCRRRGRREPLQYILGSQPFGSVDIKCRPGVLIPRSETEAYTSHLIQLIKSGDLLGRERGERGDGLNIIDFCTGTGCIPLFMYSSLQRWFETLNFRGVDISPDAVRLARDNVAHNSSAGTIPKPSDQQSLEIIHGDIFDDAVIQPLTDTRWDVLVSNPPYVSRRVWNYGHGQLGFSVRKYEPRLALVPSDSSRVPAGWVHEDIFYSRLLELVEVLRPRVVLLEIGDEAQARRVLAHWLQSNADLDSHAELWRDWPDLQPAEGECDHLRITASDKRQWTVPARGSGRIRAILLRLGTISPRNSEY